MRGSIGTETVATPRSPRPRLGSGRWAWVVLVAGIVTIAGFGAYYYVVTTRSPCQGGAHSLVVETYDSFFDSGPDPAAARAQLFGTFENETHSHVCVEYVSGDLATNLLTSGAALPDLVVGLDELTAPRVDAAGLLVPYTPPELADVPASLVSDLAPDHSVVPYEYGYIGLDYNISYDANHGSPFSSGDFLQNIQDNRSVAREFLYETPPDITGEEFLVLEIAFSTEVLHENWTGFWHAIGSVAPSTPDWGSGYSEFSAGQYASFVSYTTDPASDAYFGPAGAVNTSVLHYAGTNYSWESIYGVGIVKGGVHNLSLAEQFENYLLSGPAQSAIPLNEWEYPANASTALPGVFNWSVPPSEITPLNAFEPADEVAASLPGWILEWQAAVGG